MTSIDTAPAWRPPDLAALTPAQTRETEATPAPAGGDPREGGASYPFFGEDGFSFGDLLDIVNPLQHIPGVATVYRALTGDDIAAGPRMLGGALFGGPIGAAMAVANAVLDESTGKDAGEHLLALFESDTPDTPAEPPAAVAESSAAYAAPELAALAPLPLREATQTAEREADATRPAASAAPQARETPAREMPVAAVEAALVTARGDAFALDALANPPSMAAPGTEDRDRAESEPRSEEEAAQKGWFSAAVLAGLNKYEDAKALHEPPAAAAVGAETYY